MLGGQGMQVFVGAGLPVDEGVVEREVRSAVWEELRLLVRNLTGREGSEGTRYESQFIML